MINVGAYGNSRYGIHYSDDTAPTLPNANAALLLAPDCRDNGYGGILMENCLDSQIYSPDCESNMGNAGIVLGDNADCITVYSAYTENPASENEILLEAGSKNCTIWGYRGNTLNDAVIDKGIANLVYGRHGTKVQYSFFKNRVLFSNLMISKPDDSVLGSYHFFQDSDRSLKLKLENLDVDATFELMHNTAGKKLNFKAPRVTGQHLRIDAQDEIDTIRVRKPQTEGFTLVKQTSQTFRMDAFNVKLGDVLMLAPNIALPNGVEFFGYCKAQHHVEITIKNTTATDLDLSAIIWNIVILNGSRLT